ncbi:hypothetical protein SLE2022_183970 [Rubroshorea leprosula]
MDTMEKKATLSVTMVFMILFATFQGCFPAASQPPNQGNSIQSAVARGSLLFPVTGNVYPLGYYSVSLTIGNPPKVFEFDIDTGSDLTWVQCDAPCTGCTKPKENLYKLQKQVLVQCKDPSCEAVHSPGSPHCETPTDQCDFEVEYVDHGSALGVLVADNIFLSLTNGSKISPRLSFGCAYDLKNPGPYPPPSTDGVLGLGSGKASILSQLHRMDLTRNVIGHCLSGGGGGYVFLGDDLVPSSGVVWMPMSSDAKHYLSIPAELLLGGKPTGIKDLKIVFDSGSSYTYFSSQFYEGVLNLLRKDVKGKPLNVVNDPALPICWKGREPFKLVSDVKNYFSTLALSFTHSKNAQLQLPPEAYLIVTENGNVCLGILNGTEVGLKNGNIIGDISLQNKMVIYDNEKSQIGWISTNCNRLPKLDCSYNEDVLQPYAASFGILEEHFPATEASGKRNKFSKRKLQGKE